MRTTLIAAAALAVSLSAGCATWNNMDSSERGMAVGGTGGAVVGGVLGGPIGAGIGAAAGAYGGHHRGFGEDR